MCLRLRGQRLQVDRPGSVQPFATARSLLVLAAGSFGKLPTRVLSLATVVLQTVWLSRLHLQLSPHRKILDAHDVTLAVLDRPRVIKCLRHMCPFPAHVSFSQLLIGLV